MTDEQLEIQRLHGEIHLLEHQLDWFARCHDLWRSKYLLEHPELDNWDAVAEIEQKGPQ